MQLGFAILLLFLLGEVHRDELQHGAFRKPDHGSPELRIGEASGHALRHVPRCLARAMLCQFQGSESLASSCH